MVNEAKALLSRLARIKPFALQEAMVPAAALSPLAQSSIEELLLKERRRLSQDVDDFIREISTGTLRDHTPVRLQKRYTLLRLKFNAVLTKLDLFADVITQRSESETGVWLSGLDALAADAMALPEFYQAPPVICYLDRGMGAAIRRARTRLPGGGANPVAIIRVPRERMIGSGIASSLVHEVGHQVSACLDLVNSLRIDLRQQSWISRNNLRNFWDRWISEILADFWSVGKIGIGATQGLMGVVSLPRPFVFRVSMDDPHPIPWLRVKISAAIGQALHPDPQWQRLSQLWEELYPKDGLSSETRDLLAKLEADIPDFIQMLIRHRPKRLSGKSLLEIVHPEKRQPNRLRAFYQLYQREPAEIYRMTPSLAFAVVGQAHFDRNITPKRESTLLTNLLTHWALHSALNTSNVCGQSQQSRHRNPIIT